MHDVNNFMAKRKHQRNWLERKLDEYNHTMELIRTISAIYHSIIASLYSHKACLRNFNLTLCK